MDFGFFFVGVVVLGVIGTFIYFFSSGSGTPVKARFEAVPGPDGFWLKGDPAFRNSIVYYRCHTAGTVITGNVCFTPAMGGHFVYTGSTPTRVEITQVLSDTGTDIDFNAGPMLVVDTDYTTPAATWYASGGDAPDNPPNPPAY